MTVSDWTERYRPSTERELEGNESQRRLIRNWLSEWNNGIPSKPGILLIGPPGVGKTSIARAIANDMNWQVIELNASDARNAGAIRKAATHASTHGSLFSFNSNDKKKTLILLDEVDHLTGGLRAVSDQRISSIVRGENKESEELSGDSGGKAELLNLLQNTIQPVILACNDEMGLWGKTSSTWRTTRDRFSAHLKIIKFDRASNEALRRIANRVLKEEGYTADPGAIEHLIENNPGDLRALVRDLQVMANLIDENLSVEIVKDNFDAGFRDTSIEIFPGLERLYKSRNAEKAIEICKSLDKSPDDMNAWISWNNAIVYTDKTAIRRGSKSLSISDNMLFSRFRNTAHRSKYWTSNLSALAAAVTSKNQIEGRIFLNYPGFLRHNSAYVKKSVIERLAVTCGCSIKAVREELLPALVAIQSRNSSDFTISLSLGLTAEEHAAICGLKKSYSTTKKLMEEYSKQQVDFLSEQVNFELESTEEILEDLTKDDEEMSDSGQMKLF